MALDSYQNCQRSHNEESMLPGQKRNIGGWVVKREGESGLEEKREGRGGGQGARAGKGQEGGFSAEENGKARRQ